MAPKVIKSAVKRLTLSEKLKRMVETEGGIHFKEYIDRFKTMPEYSGFRSLSLSTQSQQDRHLRLYTIFARNVLEVPVGATDGEAERVIFPILPEDSYTADAGALARLIKSFMMFAFENATARGREDDHIKYQTLAGYRDSMMYWAQRQYRIRTLNPPPHRRIFEAATEGMRIIYQQYGYSGHRQRQIRTGIGLEELRQLLDHEMTKTYFIENSEQHQVIWNILRQTAVRPGAIGRVKGIHSDTFLTWSDVRFHTVPDNPGKFVCVLSFKNLKTNRDDPDYTMRNGGLRVLTCYLDSPSAENIIFSVPHRLLTIAIRRNLLVGISTIEELLNTKLYNIMVSSLSQVVCLGN